MNITSLPTELQHKILGHLSEDDLKKAHQVSLDWRLMIIDYKNSNRIAIEDWRWYCRHQDQIKECKICLKKAQSRGRRYDDIPEWHWWLTNLPSC